MKFLRHCRSGITYIELLLAMAIFATIIGTVLPLLFSSTENRLLQETIGLVEGNGNQILQLLHQEVRHAERILYPSKGMTGSILLIQTGSGTTNPTLFGVSSGSFILVHHANRQNASSPQVAILDFTVRNTSTSDDRPSVYVSFTVTRTIRLEAPRQYTKTFRTQIPFYPVDVPKGSACTCALPGCESLTSFAWQIYELDPGCTCYTQRTHAICK